ncbi:hypothetical protein QZH41_019767, partial [Actinostola sp. cb2023]
VRSLANVSEQSEKIDRAKKEQERILLETQASLEEVESDNTKMSHTLKLKEKKIEDLEKRCKEGCCTCKSLVQACLSTALLCKMLSQLNATLEEENKALHDKVSWLMGQQKKEDIKDINRPNRNQVQLLRVDYHDDIDTSTVNSDQHDDNVSYLRPIPPGRFDEGSIVSRDSSASGDSGRASKGLFSPNPSHTQSDVVLRRPRSHGVASTSSMMTPREIEEFQGRKVSHDVSAFRARQVRSEIFADNFHTGRLSRPKSLDNLNKIGGFRGSNDTLSSASAVAVDNAPSKNLRRGSKKQSASITSKQRIQGRPKTKQFAHYLKKSGCLTE